MSLKIYAATALLLLSACASVPSSAQAPQTVAVPMSHYSGTWLEIARRPMWLTDGCVAGTTSYTLTAADRLDLRDTCQAGTPQGKEKAIGASAVILDPGTNAKFRARYFGGFVTWEFWILDRADDYSLFISADPTFDRLWIYTRDVPSPAELSRLVERVRALGYDPARLEFPAPLTS